MSGSKNPFSLCGPDCRYKSLYTGSQASLADMAGKQAHALTRVGRLRSGMVLTLKQTYPVEFADAERQLAARMSSVDDEVLLAYLAGFLAMPRTQTAARTAVSAAANEAGLHDPGMLALRAALNEAGVSLPASDDPALWADAVAAWARTPHNDPSLKPAAQAGRLPDPPAAQTAAQIGAQTGTGGEEKTTGPTGDAIDASLHTPSPHQDPFFVPDPSMDTGPEFDPNATHADVFADAAPAGEDWVDPFASPSAPAAGAGDDEHLDWMSLFDETPQQDPEPSTTPASHEQPAQPAAGSTPASGPADQQQSPESTTPEPTPAPPSAPAPAETHATHPAPARNENATTPASEPASSGPEKEPVTVTYPKPKPVLPGTALSSPGLGDPTIVTTASAGVVKPEPLNLPTRTPTRGRKAASRRTPRVSATGPQPTPLLPETPPVDPSATATTGLTGAQAGTAAVLDDRTREMLLATVCLPRPVFIADLVHLVGDPDVIEQWEKECRAAGTASPVRFIAAKQRHRARGHLVIPYDEETRNATEEFRSSLWNKAIGSNVLRGAKLYELAVLLHRYADQVATFDIGTDTVTLRINLPRGLTGVILTLSADLAAGTPARVELAEALTQMTSGRLSLLAVCTYTAGPGAVAALAESAREIIEAADMSVPFPVIAQTSWEFAADGGVGAVSVLG